MLRWAHVMILLAGLGLLLAVVLEASNHRQWQTVTPPDLLDPQPMDGKAPPFALADRANRVHTLAEFKDKWVLLVFWATWCEPCKEELPHLATMAMKFANEPFYLLMVSVDKKFQDIDAMASQLRKQAPSSDFPKAWEAASVFISTDGPNFITLLDPDAKLAHKYGTSMFPESYLIDPHGMLRKKFIGAKPWGIKEAIGELETMMTGKVE